MTVRELYAKLNEIIPPRFSCEWDNDGLMCCPDGNRQVKKLLIALDVTTATVDKAINEGFDCILSHHPFIFGGLKSITDGVGVEGKAIRLIKNDIAVMSFHTRLDAVEGGVNDTLCRLLGIENVSPIYEEEIPLGRVGTLAAPMTAKDFALRVKQTLGAPVVLLSDVGKMSHKVAVVGGSGKDFIELAKASGADTYISGRLDYHPMTDAPDMGEQGINLLEAGHFYTEYPVCSVLADMVNKISPTIECEIYFGNIIEAI